MTKAVQDKRKYLVVIPIIMAGLVAGSFMMNHRQNDEVVAKTINDTPTPLAGPGQGGQNGENAGVSLFQQPVVETADGTLVTTETTDNAAGAAEKAILIQQLTADLADAQVNYEAAQSALEAAENQLLAAQSAKAKTQADLEAAEKAVEEAQAAVDSYAQLKEIYQAVMAMADAVEYANENGTTIKFKLQEDGTYESEKVLKDYFDNSNGYALNSTGHNYAPGFNQYVLESQKIDVSNYFYRVYSKDGRLNVFIAIAKESGGYDVYKYMAAGEGTYEAGTLLQGTASITVTGNGNAAHNTIVGNSFQATNDRVASYQEILTAEQELAAAKTAEADAQAKDEAAQEQVEAAEETVSQKQQEVQDAEEQVEEAQTQLDAANAQ